MRAVLLLSVIAASSDHSINISLAVFTGVLAAVGVLQWIALHLQAGHLRRGLSIAQASAETAKLSAQAIINSERPWIITRVVLREVKVPTKDAASHSVVVKKFFTFTISNIGKTPAQIVSVFSGHKYTNCGEQLPDIPDYSAEFGLEQQRILAPHERWNYENWPTTTVSISGKWYWRYGRVVYRNVLDSSHHETSFCFLYSEPLNEFLLGGPSEYTKYT